MIPILPLILPLSFAAAQPLTVDDAARLALARNAAFKATLEEVGLAEADLAQAGIVENPRVHGALRFAGGEGRQGHELGVKVSLLDLFELPLRRRVAAGRLEQARARLSHEVLDLQTRARAAFFEHAAAARRLELSRGAFESLDAASDLAERQRAAGNLPPLDLAAQSAEREEAGAALARAEAEAVAAREKLAMLLALQGSTWTAVVELPEPPDSDPEPAEVEARALERRWDLQAARREPKVLKDASFIERARFFSPFELGVDTEREYSGESKYGPEFELGVPLFDRRQAARRRLRVQQRQSLASVEALEAQVRYEARAAAAQLAAARRAFEARRRALPLRRTVLAETLKNYNFMLKGVYELLAARRAELAASSEYVDALRDYWIARAELERVAGGSL